MKRRTGTLHQHKQHPGPVTAAVYATDTPHTGPESGPREVSTWYSSSPCPHHVRHDTARPVLVMRWGVGVGQPNGVCPVWWAVGAAYVPERKLGQLR